MLHIICNIYEVLKDLYDMQHIIYLEEVWKNITFSKNVRYPLSRAPSVKSG